MKLRIAAGEFVKKPFSIDFLFDIGESVVACAAGGAFIALAFSDTSQWLLYAAVIFGATIGLISEWRAR